MPSGGGLELCEMSGGFGKPDATGRSSGTRSGNDRKLRSPPKGEAWAWMTHDMLASPSMRALSLTGRRLLDFLLIENMNHAGTENGALLATKDQLMAFGLSRRLIAPAVRELVFLGLVRVERGRLTRGGVKAPNLYRLTFYADNKGAPATNEWKGTTDEAIAVWKTYRIRSKKRTHRQDIEVGPQSGSGESAKTPRLTLVQGPQNGSGNGQKVGPRK